MFGISVGSCIRDINVTLRSFTRFSRSALCCCCYCFVIFNNVKVSLYARREIPPHHSEVNAFTSHILSRVLQYYVLSQRHNENDETRTCSHFDDRLARGEQCLFTVLGENFLFRVVKIHAMCRYPTLNILNKVIFFRIQPTLLGSIESNMI
jgi:hypothetical protein